MTRATTALTPEFLEETVVARGVTYRYRELSIGEYDELLKKAIVRRKRPNPLTGEEIEVEERDDTILLRLMIMKCAVDPRLGVEALGALPARVVFALGKAVNDMHYGDEPASTPSANGSQPEESDEDTAKGND